MIKSIFIGNKLLILQLINLIKSDGKCSVLLKLKIQQPINAKLLGKNFFTRL